MHCTGVSDNLTFSEIFDQLEIEPIRNRFGEQHCASSYSTIAVSQVEQYHMGEE
jgi:hypothetical protein